MNRYTIHSHKLPNLDHLIRVGSRIKYTPDTYTLGDGKIIEALERVRGTVVEITDNSLRYACDEDGKIRQASFNAVEHE